MINQQKSSISRKRWSWTIELAWYCKTLIFVPVLWIMPSWHTLVIPVSPVKTITQKISQVTNAPKMILFDICFRNNWSLSINGVVKWALELRENSTTFNTCNQTYFWQLFTEREVSFLKPNKQLTLLPICGVWIWQIVRRIELRKIFRMTWATLNNSRRPGLNKAENCRPYRQHSRTSISAVYLCNLLVWKTYAFEITATS